MQIRHKLSIKAFRSSMVHWSVTIYSLSFRWKKFISLSLRSFSNALSIGLIRVNGLYLSRYPIDGAVGLFFCLGIIVGLLSCLLLSALISAFRV